MENIFDFLEVIFVMVQTIYTTPSSLKSWFRLCNEISTYSNYDFFKHSRKEMTFPLSPLVVKSNLQSAQIRISDKTRICVVLDTTVALSLIIGTAKLMQPI